MRLFVAGVDGGLSPPTESFYAGDADRGHVGTAFAIVESDYKALGVAPVASGSVSSDHVATELEVLAFLCAREAVCWQEDDKAAALVELRHQNDFLQAHLSWWLPQFRLRVIGAGAAPFYGAVVEGAVAVVRHDCDYVRALLDQVPQ